MILKEKMTFKDPQTILTNHYQLIGEINNILLSKFFRTR